MNLNEPINPQRVGQAVGKYRWTICALLFFATTVNYLDRQVLSLLAPELSTQFGWSNTDYANIASVFQFVYAISMLFAGRLVDKIGTKSAYILAIAVWSTGAVMHAFAVPMGEGIASLSGAIGLAVIPVSIAGFMLSRAVLAIGEAGNFPIAIKATAEYFPKKERSFATGIFNSGANVGAILAPICVPLIAALWGWEAAFIVIGGLGFVWVAVWIALYESPEKQKRLSAEELAYIRSDSPIVIDPMGSNVEAKKVSWFKLLSYRQTWAFAFGKFMTDGVWWFFLFWLPTYLSAQYGMKGSAIVLPLSVLYTMTMVGSIGGGWFPSYFMSRGDAPYDGRMKAMLVIACFPLLVLLAQPFGYISFWVPVLLIGVGASAHQAWSCNIFTTVSDMFPQKSIASVVGIGGLAGGLGGVVMTKIGGWVIDHYKMIGDIHTGYMIMFAICAVAYLVAWSVMKALVPRHKEITDL
ncbi:MFS transporter [Pseudomonas sp. SWRI74]|jgi:ACS family hexuronate transporter-like MFS transporter|uniref:Hexuronate transporter n=2 Tax=Pseudomonas TaxID=286 RepID=A0A5E7D349_PSEFL|nr:MULTISPECIES: MFS transporter [Pseudomonas]MBV4518471.1 MFS transporter [Pseudomonas azerbaijanoccidentalis]MCK8665301.1 MFS transporter [Pseudomonas azerbaijanoccidentalis]VVO08568.1 Hexuronate transporter [Pseudomonas fluorescens]